MIVTTPVIPPVHVKIETDGMLVGSLAIFKQTIPNSAQINTIGRIIIIANMPIFT